MFQYRLIFFYKKAEKILKCRYFGIWRRPCLTALQYVSYICRSVLEGNKFALYFNVSIKYLKSHNLWQWKLITVGYMNSRCSRQKEYRTVLRLLL